MKKNTYKLFYTLTIIFSFAHASSSYTINNIIVGPKSGDPKDKFSLVFELNNTGNTEQNWKLGFYMPRSFRTTSTMNTKLQMSICEVTTKKHKNCAPLSYQRANFTDNDLSTVFTTILAPTIHYPLQHNKKYTIQLLHDSSRMPQNYSALPQSFFIINSHDQVINIATTPSDYTLTSLNSQDIQQKVMQHIADEWESSNNITPQLNIVPSPQQVSFNNPNSFFDLSHNLTIHNLSTISAQQLSFWQNYLAQDFNQTITSDTKSSNSGIILVNIKDKKLGSPEGYIINITNNKITVQAANDAGFFYALQTLRQLWQASPNLPSVTIMDYPRFKYRGILLDTARHFFSVAEIENFLDIMAANKLNTLHLHLSDDEGFRLQIPAYPELTTIGAKRGYGLSIGTMGMIQQNLSKSNSNAFSADTIQQGSYSPNDIKNLINYANARQITIIPEIDIPGHSRSLMKSLPNSLYEPNDTSDYNGFGDNALPVCAYNSSSQLGQNFTPTIQNIIKYTANAFNNQETLYAQNNEVSIGGDEVGERTWSKSPECDKVPWNSMNQLEKEHYFISLLANDLNKNNIKLSGWHEFILTDAGNIDSLAINPNAVGHVWQWGTFKEAQAKAQTLANNNYPTILAYSNNLYFDMTYTADIREPGLYWAGKSVDTFAALNSARKASKTQNNTQHPENILGLEAGLWADVIPNYSQLQYMAVPKIAGLAEAAWSNENVTNDSNNYANWHSLATRLGCGNSGFLYYLNKNYGVVYRGYPNGIALEAPYVCQNIN